MNYHWGAQRHTGSIQIVQQAVCLIARAEARAEDEDEVAGLLQDLAEDVRAEERGCLSFSVTRALGSSTHFAVHARFSDMRAFQRHGLTKHMRKAMPELSARLATPVSLEVFLEI